MDLHTQLHGHTEQYKNSFSVRTAVDWNRLDNTTVHADSEQFLNSHCGQQGPLDHCAAPRRCVYARYLDAVTYPTDADTDTDNFVLSESALPDLRHLYAKRKIP